MKRIICFVSLLCVALLLFTGCVQFRTTITVKDTGKIDLNMLYSMSESLLAMSDSDASIDEDMIQDYKEKGYDCVPYSRDGYTGYTISKSNISDLSDGIVGNEGSLTKNGNTYILDIPWNTQEEGSDAASLGMMSEMISSQNGFAEIVIILPVKPITHNATSVSEDGKTLTWNLLTMGNRESVHVEYTVGSIIGLWILRIAIGIAVIAVIVLAFLFIKKTAKSKKEKKIAAQREYNLFRLREFKTMLEENLITQEEYEKKKEEILKSLSDASGNPEEPSETDCGTEVN